MAEEKLEKNFETHVSNRKKKTVEELKELMKKKTVMIVSIKNLPAAQFQEIKKKLRDKARIIVTKKSLINLALEESAAKGLEKLEEVVDESFALLFSDEDAFEISALLTKNQTPAKAKAGQVAVEDIKVEAGPTDLMPGPDISALGAVGLKVKVENGKIAIEESAVIIKKGEEISEAKASILAKLDITPFKIGLEPLAAFFDGKAYFDIKINPEEVVESLVDMYSRGLAFAVSLDYLNKETLPFVLGKAASHENALSQLIKEDSEENKSESTEEKAAEEAEAKPEEDSEKATEKPEEKSEGKETQVNKELEETQS